MTRNNFWEAQPLGALKVSTTSRLALILSQSPVLSKLLVTFILIIYQVEIFTIVLKPTAHSIKTGSQAPSQIFINVYNIVYFEELDIITKSADNVLSLLGIIGIYLFWDISIFLCLTIFLHRGKQIKRTVENICNGLSCIHQLILFGPIHVYCCKVLYLSYNREDLIFSSENLILLVKILCLLIMVTNSIWCLIKILLFTININTKDLLSSKTNLITLLDFIFRVTLPLLEAFALPHGTSIVAFLIANLVYSVLRDYFLFYTLPYYRIQTLKIATICHAVITSLAFATIISRPISQSRAYPELEFLLPFWILCIVVFKTLYTRYLNSLTQAILQHPVTITNPYHLIHYLVIYKLYAKCSQPAVHSDMTEEKYFIYTSIIKQSAVAHLLPAGEDIKLDHKAQTLINEHFAKYSIDLLENAVKKNQKFSLLRMTLAHYYTKYERRYMLAYQILGHNLHYSFSLQNSSVLVKILIWNGITNQDSNQEDGIIQKYIHLQEIYKNLNNDIKEQLKKGVQFWKDFQNPDTEFYSLVNLAGQISKKSKDITKSVAYYQIFKEVNFVEPLLVYTFYVFFVQNDILKAQKFFQEYNRLKLRKIQVDSIPSKKSKMFPSDALFFTLSSSPKHFGTILDCSGQAMNKLGITKELFLKRHLSTIMPQSYAKWYDDYLKGIALNSNLEMLNKAMDIPIMMKDGHIMSHWMHITLNYSNEFGLCLSGLLRPIWGSQQTVLIMKNGHILNTTREFAEDMNIELNKYRNNESIFDFCPSLEEILFNFLSEGQRCSTTQNRFHHLSSVAFEKQEVIPAKEIQLQFLPSMNSQIRDDFLIASERNSQTITYTVKIYLHNNQGNTFFELKMEKVKDNKHQSTLLVKPSETHRSLNIYTAKESQSSQLDPMNVETMYPLQKRESSLKALRNKNLRSEAIDSQIGAFMPSKRETGGVNKTNMNHMETISESVNNCVTHVNTPSERKEFLSSPKGDTDNEFDLISDEQRSNHDFSSVSFDKNIKKTDDTLALDFMSISSSNSSSLFSNVKKIDVYKVMRKAIDSRAYKWSSHAYNLCFIATFIVQMGFLIWLNIYTSSISHNVGALSQVIQSSYLRTYWLKIASMDMMSWISVKGGWFDYDWEQVREVFKNDLYKTTLHNQDLGIYLNAIDEEVQQRFYEKQVELYERDSLDNPQLVSIDDTFEATKKIINYGLISSNQLIPTSGMNIINTATQFVAENGLNNFLIVAENLTSFVEEKLFSTLTNAKRNMLGGLFGGVIFIILFIFVSLIFVTHINKDASRFMKLLFTLPANEVAKTEYYLSTLTDLLEKETDDTEVLDTLNGINPKLQRKATFKDSEIGKTNKSKKIAHKASMKKFNSRNYFIFDGLFVCLGSLMALMVIYYRLANDKIVVMERQHTGLNSALNFANTMAYLPAELQGLLLWNGTLTVENKPPLQFLRETISKLSKVTNFAKSLEDSKGDISSVQQAILFNYSCDQAYTPYYSWPLEVLQVECESISDGLGYTGLINVLLKLEHELNQFIYDFENKPRELLDLQNLLGSLLVAGFCTDIGFVLLFNSFAYSLETFGSLVTELENRRVILAWIAVISSIALGAATWIFIIRRLVRKEFEKKRMLALVPNRLIFGSYLLTKYITTNLK